MVSQSVSPARRSVTRHYFYIIKFSSLGVERKQLPGIYTTDFKVIFTSNEKIGEY